MEDNEELIASDPIRIYQREDWLKICYQKKYQEIRDAIENAFGDLVFDEGPHKYYLGDMELECVSNTIHNFQEHFDTDEMAQKTFERNYNNVNSKYYQMTPEMIKEEWTKISTKATTLGSARHNFGESVFWFMLNQFDKIVPEFNDRLHKDEDGRYYMEALYPKEKAVIKYWNEIPTSIVPILAENKVYDKDNLYAGTFDILFAWCKDFENEESPIDGLYIMDYKGLPLDTYILTAGGWKTMGTLNESDYVYDKDGNNVKILHISEIHYNPCYKIVFDNGESIVCDQDHRWLVTIQIYGNQSMVEKVMTAKELYDYNNTRKKGSFYIPRIYNHMPLKDKYNDAILGLKLLMRERGGYDKERNLFYIDGLSTEPVSLYQLGIKPKVEGNRIYFWYDDYKAFYDDSDNVVQKKVSRKHEYRLIVNIIPVDTVPTKCIEVDSPSHTYLCGRNLLVTHNTNKDLYKNFNEKKLLPPFDNLLDNSLNIYKLQLSAYQNCLNKIGLKVVARSLIWLRPNCEYEKIKLESYTETLRDALQEKIKRGEIKPKMRITEK